MTKKDLAPTIVLVCICLVASLLLALTYQVTKPLIDAINLENATKARSEALPTADGFTQLDTALEDGVVDIYKANNGTGYVITAKGKGFKGQVEAMIGVDATGKIVKVVVTDVSTETVGLGSKVAEPKYTDQYTGIENIDGLSTVNSVSGATYSSKGIFSCVSSALLQIQSMGGNL